MEVISERDDCGPQSRQVVGDPSLWALDLSLYYIAQAATQLYARDMPQCHDRETRGLIADSG